MLIIQSLNTYYEKWERSSEFARLRTGDMFRKIDLSKIKKCEVFAQNIRLRYDKGGKISQAQPFFTEYRQYGENIFTEGTQNRYDNFNKLLQFIRIFKEEDKYKVMFCDENVEWCPTKRWGHNEAFNVSLPENVRDFLRITNGFYINGKVFFSMINDNVKEISPRATNRTRDIIGFNRYYRSMTDIEEYIILGKDSISYFVYDIASEKYRILTNGTLDVMNEFNSLAQMIREVLV